MRAPRTGSGWARAVSLGRSGRLHLARGSGWARAASLGRSLRASMPFARSMLARSRHPAFARQQRRLRGTGPPLANPYSVGARVGKGYRHLASLGARPLFHRSPPARAGGTAGRWAVPASGSPSTRSLPQSPTRPHNQATTRGFRRFPGGRRAVGPSRSRFPQTVHHQPAQSAVTTAEARGEPVPCRPDARCRLPAFRSLDAGSLSASLPSLASNAGSTARAHPSRTRIRYPLTHRSPPERAGGASRGFF